MCFKRLPHPEEPVNRDQTAENVNVGQVLDRWISAWYVTGDPAFWKNQIVIEVKPDLAVDIGGIWTPVPALTYEADGKRHLEVRPEWLNPGVIAHEQAHNSYALLSEEQRAAFKAVYEPLKTSDRLIKFLYSKNRYGLSSDVEGHAEVYRYIGEKMPAALKPFYPKLLEIDHA